MSARVCIFGSRDIDGTVAYAKLVEGLDDLSERYKILEVVSGCCRGVDKLGERWATERNIHVEKFPADWSLGKRAGPIRNKKMVNYSDIGFYLWDGGSSGTKSTIKMFEQSKKFVTGIILTE